MSEYITTEELIRLMNNISNEFIIHVEFEKESGPGGK